MRFTMAVYTVHEPPPQRDQPSGGPERFAFVRDGFSFWAFLLGPLWMLRHRMWLVLLGYGIVVVGIEIGSRALGVSQPMTVTIGIMLALLIGFEASTLRRFTLGRRRWTNVGVIVGNNLETAERRFFDAWVGQEGARQSSPAPAPRQPPAAPDVIGLFPQPGARP
jgi:hypothetical protein